MTVDKFGRRGIDDRSDVSLKFINKSFLRRDGGNTVTGWINMTGNTFNNVVNPTSDRDVATKAYIDSNCVGPKKSFLDMFHCCCQFTVYLTLKQDLLCLHPWHMVMIIFRHMHLTVTVPAVMVMKENG